MNIFGRVLQRDKVPRIPAGAFTFDDSGEILVGTVPMEWLREYGPPLVGMVRRAFSSTEQKNRPMSELVINFTGVRITARNLRGGGIIFLFPIKS